MKKVRCIRGAGTPFKDGMIYEVVRDEIDGSDHYFIMKGHESAGGYFQSRFVVVEDDTVPPTPVKALSYECPCGIARVQCDYHKPNQKT